jgi:hypothetical protein
MTGVVIAIESEDLVPVRLARHDPVAGQNPLAPLHMPDAGLHARCNGHETGVDGQSRLSFLTTEGPTRKGKLLPGLAPRLDLLTLELLDAQLEGQLGTVPGHDPAQRRLSGSIRCERQFILPQDRGCTREQ